MRPRSAAALAFVGWLLVFPSGQPPSKKGYHLSVHSPQRFKSYIECREALDDMHKNLAKWDVSLSEWYSGSRGLHPENSAEMR